MIEYQPISFFKNDKLFRPFNTCKMVDAYAQKHEVGITYEIKNREWIFDGNKSSINIFDTETVNMNNNSSQLGLIS